MKFSVFTVITAELNLEELLAKLKQFGYEGIELRVHTNSENDPDFWTKNKSTLKLDTIIEDAEGIKKLCSKYGIEICGLSTYLKLNQVKEIEDVLKAAVLMGCPRIRVWQPAYKGDTNYNELYNETVKNLKVLEPLVKKYNVKINIETHHGTIAPSASLAHKIVSNFDSRYIGVIYDAGNMIHEGYEKHKMGLELLGDYLDHVHIKNANWTLNETKEDGCNLWKCEWSTLRKGQVCFQEQIASLKSINYDGYLSFEDFSTEFDVCEKLKNNIEYLRSII